MSDAPNLLSAHLQSNGGHIHSLCSFVIYPGQFKRECQAGLRCPEISPRPPLLDMREAREATESEFICMIFSHFLKKTQQAAAAVPTSRTWPFSGLGRLTTASHTCEENICGRQ